MNALAKRKIEERDPRLWTADQFLDFYMTRPDEERWQLVDGLPMMMTPPTFDHQKIGKRLLNLLDEALAKNRPDLEAFYEMGVRLPGADGFYATPDIIVVRADALFERYANTYFLVAEMISPSNTTEMIDRKIELCQMQPDNLYCLVVDQKSVHATLYARESGWARADLHSLDDTLALPAFGFEARLSQIYKGTPLAPSL